MLHHAVPLATAPGKALRVERLLANLGYGKRKECQVGAGVGCAAGVGARRVWVSAGCGCCVAGW